MQKDDNIIFVRGCMNKVICKKVVSNGWCKESNETPKCINSAGSTRPIVVVGSFLHCLRNFADVNIS